ncbi:unnamed protein product, partial [Brenthis ino]
MYACGVNNSEILSSDFWLNSVMYSESTENNTLTFNHENNLKEFSSCHVNSNGRIKYIMNKENSKMNFERCIVKYNADQHCLSLREISNYAPDQMDSIEYYVNNHQKNLPTYMPKSTIKATLKRKRRRTIFTTKQIVALEEVFKKKPYVHREERIELMNKLNVNERSIKVWFQNRRRLSERKCQDYILDSPTSEDLSETMSDRLTLIESYIKHNSDENGYVILDSEMMNNLVDIIDECLPQDINLLEKTITEPHTNVNKMVYEPISPVSLSENSEDIDLRVETQEKLLGITDYYYL